VSSPLTPHRAQGATLKENTSEEKELARVYRRFYLALQLRDLCNEMSFLASTTRRVVQSRPCPRHARASLQG